MTFTVRGGRKAVISQFTTAPPLPGVDDALLKALARAHRWRQQIESGEYASITDLAKAHKVNQSYACRLLRLTLLAPAIVNGILNGRDSSNLTLRQLTKPFPVLWGQQMEILKFPQAPRTHSPAEALRSLL